MPIRHTQSPLPFTVSVCHKRAGVAPCCSVNLRPPVSSEPELDHSGDRWSRARRTWSAHSWWEVGSRTRPWTAGSHPPSRQSWISRSSSEVQYRDQNLSSKLFLVRFYKNESVPFPEGVCNSLTVFLEGELTMVDVQGEVEGLISFDKFTTPESSSQLFPSYWLCWTATRTLFVTPPSTRSWTPSTWCWPGLRTTSMTSSSLGTITTQRDSSHGRGR